MTANPEIARVVDPDRPSQHGAVVGRVITELERIGRETLPDLPLACLTCAFREGSAPNQMASTAMVAFKCATGADRGPFGCHHGMHDGLPAKLCAGYFAAQHAMRTQFARAKELILGMSDSLAELPAHDSIREAFDAWWNEVDPDRTMDAYQFARAYARYLEIANG